MVEDADRLRRFAERWISQWNARDLEGILAHYAEDICFTSPLARKLTGHSAVRGIEALRSYWTEGLRRRPDLHFHLLDLFACERGLAILFEDESGRRTIETMTFDETGRITGSSGFYRI